MAVARISREDWRSVAGRLALFAMLVFGVTAHAVGLSASLHRFESGAPVRPTTYVARFTEIAATEGRPYRDFPVEYPPVSLGAIELVAGTNGNQTGVNLIWFMVFCDLVTVAALAFGWGRRAAVLYLLLTVPLLGFLFTTIDLISVALAVGAIALMVRRRERLGGVAFAAAILAKVWPLAILPLMILQRKLRALTWSAGALTLGTFMWVWWGGPSGPLQVATQRHTPGWEYESLIGSVLWALGRGGFVSINDSARLGVAPGWAKAVLLCAAVVGISAVWYRASRREPREIGFPAVAAVSILLLAAPLLSPPYMIWLAPWAAIACTERRGHVRWLLAAPMLVGGLMLVASSAFPDVPLWSVKALLLLRNALLVAVPAVYLLERGIAPTEDPAAGSGVETRLKISPSSSS
jgi:Glycosyltransferase family 87